MSTNTYSSYPKVTLTWSNNNLSYVVVSYYGNAIVKNGSTTTSSNQTGTSYTTGDLSFSALYTFTMTPYNSTGTAGTAKTFTVDTTPKITGSYASVSTTSSAQIQWYGTYSYVKIWRKVTSPYTTSYIDVSANTNITTMPYNDTDLCGNTTYVYYVQPYDAGGSAYSASNTVTVTTSAQAASNLSTVFYDSSSIQVSFTLPKNSYSSSYYYTLRATNSSTSANTDVTGTTSPLWVKGLSSGTTYSCYILSYLDGALGATSSGLSVTTSESVPTDYTFYLRPTSTTMPTTDILGTTITNSGCSVVTVNAGTNRTYAIGCFSGKTFSANITIGTSFTFCLWYYVYVTGDFYIIPSGNSSLMCTADPQSLVINSSGTNNRIGYPSFTLNQWSHVSFVYYSSGIFIIYKNGSVVSTTNPAVTGVAANTQSYTFGRNGYITHLRVYSRALSATEIAAIYSNDY